MSQPDPTINQALAATRDALSAASDAPSLEARRLLEHVLAASTTYLITRGDQTLSDAQARALDELIARRQGGEPLAYILGSIGFWDMELAVDARVLVPRADTETLIEAVLERLPTSALAVADLGTGSGAIALALARERPAWRVLATDASIAALDCARHNAQRLELAQVTFRAGRWYEALADQRFDALVSNPPYIDPADPHLQAAALRHEPQNALIADDRGRADLNTIVSGAPAHLNTRGLIALEHGYDQGPFVRQLLENHDFVDIQTRHDLGGQPRVTLGVLGD